MKKTLIALAVLAASGAAMAQSSVTLYGRVDAFVGAEKTGVGAAEVTKTGVFNGGLTGSRWGIKGSEDLGGGLKAMFLLENRFNIDTGDMSNSVSATGFGGDAYVALGGGFGTVKLGRTYTAFDDVRAVAKSNDVFDSSFAAQNGVFSAGADYTSRGANGVRYDSPVMSGVSGAVSYAFGEDKTVSTGSSHISSLALKYATNGLKLAYGHQRETSNGNKYNQLSGAYDFGMAAVSAGYVTRSGASDNDDKGYELGLNVPVAGTAINVGLGYARDKNEVAGVVQAKNSGYGLGATYTMSKRTKLYVGYRNTKVENGAGAETGKTRLFGAGVRHDF